MTRLRRFLRRLDDWLADPETVPFSPVCCRPPAVRCEVAGLGRPPLPARPHPPLLQERPRDE